MKYLRRFLENDIFDDIKYDIDGILCQLKDIGIDYTLSNFEDLIIIEMTNQNVNTEFNNIFNQLDEFMTNKEYSNKKVYTLSKYFKYYLPLDSDLTMNGYIAKYAGASSIERLNTLFGRTRGN